MASSTGSLSDMPFPVLATMLLIVYLFALCIYTLPDMQNGNFLWSQFGLDFSLAIILCFFVGAVTLLSPADSFFATYSVAILPLVVIFSLWLKVYLVYAFNLYEMCSKPSEDGSTGTEVGSYQVLAVIFNSFKVAVSVFIVYSVLVFFPAAVNPFFELFSSSHPIIYYVGTGFWLGACTWPGEASAFYSLQSGGCLPSTKIEFTDLSQGASSNKTINEYA